eukprot:GHVQ01025769.1.p1 GENE.GHVQ01025769.1~~GHVQ01025769.1.p1  ORF type:complete len:221 (-),score=49.68 GHVQ01025769.1:514-1176(-)
MSCIGHQRLRPILHVLLLAALSTTKALSQEVQHIFLPLIDKRSSPLQYDWHADVDEFVVVAHEAAGTGYVWGISETRPYPSCIAKPKKTKKLLIPLPSSQEGSSGGPRPPIGGESLEVTYTFTRILPPSTSDTTQAIDSSSVDSSSSSIGSTQSPSSAITPAGEVCCNQCIYIEYARPWESLDIPPVRYAVINLVCTKKREEQIHSSRAREEGCRRRQGM